MSATTETSARGRQTTVGIEGDSFTINGQLTFPGRQFRGRRVEGLLPNARLVQGIFDDRNDETRGRWNYPDGPWDADRNTAEFLAAMPRWRERGLLAFTINLQGGSPEGYSASQPWHNSAFESDGAIRGDYLARLERILDRADELGMVAIVGLFYFGQDQRLANEAAVVRGADLAADWLLERGYRNVLVEINNEADVKAYDHAILRPDRVAELIRRVRERSAGRLDTPARRLLVGTSMGGGSIPPESIVSASDFVLIHGNGVGEPDRIRWMVDQCRASAGYRGQPVVFNEDDHYGFDQPDNNMLAALDRHASWGYFDYRQRGEGYADGFQSVPVDWQIRSPRKRGFFDLLARVTGSQEQ